VLFENAPAVISGIDDALKAMGKRDGVNLLAVAGDGGTADIGLAALSGAIERNQDFMYVCFDNESYMNTGGQRSGTTPFGARTSTTPIGKVVKGEDRPPVLRKNMVEIVAAHRIPYAAFASVAYPMDLLEKVEKAKNVRGPSYIHISNPCPTGWGVDPKDVINVARAGVETGCVVLYEFEDGIRRVTKRVRKPKPIEEYLKYQARYRHVLADPAALSELQKSVDDAREELLRTMAA
jgi:pyruvate ferredoxin oxidoreductase beta subunit